MVLKEAERFCREGALGLGFEEAIQTDKGGKGLAGEEDWLSYPAWGLRISNGGEKMERRPGTRQWSLCLSVKCLET